MSSVLNLLKEPTYFLYNLPPEIFKSKQMEKNLADLFHLTILPIFTNKSKLRVQALLAESFNFYLHLDPRTSQVSHYQVLKRGAEFAGTYFHLKVGLFIHTAITLGENLNDLRYIRGNLAPQMVRVASNALYLLSMCKIKQLEKYSSRIAQASLLVEAGSQFIQAALAANSALKAKAQRRDYISPGFEALTKSMISCIRCYQAGNQFKQTT